MNVDLDVRWEAPPDKVLTGSRSAPHRDGVAAQLGDVVERLKANPGRWSRVFVGSRNTLNNRVLMMRAGGYGFAPSARWHIAAGMVDPERAPNVYGVWARYLPADVAAAAVVKSTPLSSVVLAARAPVRSEPPRPAPAAPSRPLTRVPAAADLQLLCQCLHPRRLHGDDAGTYRGYCRRTGCDCGGYAEKGATS